MSTTLHATIQSMKSIIFLLLVLTFTSTTSVSVKANTNDQNTFSYRVENYKKRFPTNLNEEELKIIIDKCDSVKSKFVKIRDSVNATTLKREDTYGDVERRLSAIQSRFDKQGIDSSVIDLMLASYRIEVSNFKNSADEYQTILNDIVAIDCISDPSALKSAVTSARFARDSTKTAVTKVKEAYNVQVVTGFDLLNKQLLER